MNAVILAGGFGSRLRPLTDNTIKPMLELANVPMVDYTVAHLASININDIVFTLSHKPETIIEWALGYSDINCHFSIETLPLGTLGGVKAAQRFLDDTFIVMSGDALENINLSAMLHKHKASGSSVTIAVKESENTHLYGVVEFDAWGTITGFTEKPPKGTQKSQYVNCGVYIVEKKVLSNVKDFAKCDFSKDLFPALLNGGGKLSAFIHEGYWCDIGDIRSYYKANYDVFEKGFFASAPNSHRLDYSAYHIGSVNRSLISATCVLSGRVSNCILGRGARVASDAVLENCIVMDGATARGRHTNAIIGSDYIIHDAKNDMFVPELQNSAQISNYFL